LKFCYLYHIVSKIVVEGAKQAGWDITALSCLGFEMTHQSALVFIGENLVTWPCTDARGAWGCVPRKRKQICGHLANLWYKANSTHL
jgi:hypothetical protein